MINVKELLNKGLDIQETVLNFLRPYKHLQIEYFDDFEIFIGINRHVLELPHYIVSWERGIIFRFIYAKTKDGWVSLHKSIYKSYRQMPYLFDELEAIVIVEKGMLELQPSCTIYFTDRKEIEKTIEEIEIENLVNDILESEV